MEELVKWWHGGVNGPVEETIHRKKKLTWIHVFSVFLIATTYGVLDINPGKVSSE